MTEDAPRNEQSIEELQMGDAFADDGLLTGKLPEIVETVNADSDASDGFRAWIKSTFAYCFVSGSWSRISKTVKLGAALFTGFVPPIVRARAEATATTTKADADAEVRRARARRIDAESAKLLAEADQIRAGNEETRAQTKRKDDILRELKKQGINFGAIQEDGAIPRILFSLRPDLDKEKEQGN